MYDEISDIVHNRNQIPSSSQRFNNSEQFPMDVDNIETSNFQLLAEELFPV